MGWTLPTLLILLTEIHTMPIVQLDQQLSHQLADLYQRMETAYDQVAKALNFTCAGCPDNCCDSYFQHHTYIEWAYLWEGLNELAPERLQEITARAKDYIKAAEASLARDERPMIMCPLNEAGLCALYKHRLMICRMHGVPSLLRRPDGQQLHFPGCFRCQEIVEGRSGEIPSVDRTKLYLELIELENRLTKNLRHILPRVKKSIAQMIVQGPPEFSGCGFK